MNKGRRGPYKKRAAEPGGNHEKGAARLAVLRTLAEPFTPESFAAAAGIEKKIAGITLCGYANKGYIKRVGTGEYRFAAGPKLAAGGSPARQEPRPTVAKVAPAVHVDTGPVDPLEKQVYFAAKHEPEEFSAMSIHVSTGRGLDSVKLALVRLTASGYVKVVGKEDGEEVYRVAK